MASLTLRANVVTDSSGAATVYLSQAGQSSTPVAPLSGMWEVASISYVKNDFASGIDFAITEYPTGAPLWTGTNVDASTTFYPRAFVGDPASGAVSTSVYDVIRVHDSQIKIVISSGGTSKEGRFYIKLVTPQGA